MSADLPKGPFKRPQRIAIDIHEVPYHGQPLRERNEIRRGHSRHGTTHFHDYATAYVVRKGYCFTLAMAWIRQDGSLTDVVQCLLRQVRKSGVKVRLVLLDRGFFSAEVVGFRIGFFHRQSFSRNRLAFSGFAHPLQNLQRQFRELKGYQISS
ncbi:MAG: hypothetical protein DME65_03870 [Verrucomicrobia bacterium]|nr:MAG: hypothetical protein DME65_03870 [Verrucomicrobiota bacterium]